MFLPRPAFRGLGHPMTWVRHTNILPHHMHSALQSARTGGFFAGMVSTTFRKFRQALFGRWRQARLVMPLAGFLLAAAAWGTAGAQTDLPDAPIPSPDLLASSSVATSGTPADAASFLPAGLPEGQQTFPPAEPTRRRLRMPGLQASYLPMPRECITNYCSQSAPLRRCCVQTADAFQIYLKQNAIHIYTPRELGRLAVRGVIDPFNLLTIVGTSAYSVATDAHSPYGPGGYGIAKLSGVALTQDMTNAFVETFLISSIDHQDPLYHRMPNASVTRRVLHCLYQPFWTDSDTGKGMVNYATVFGAMVDEAVDVSYVPYQQAGWGASADRVAVNLATTPLGNFVTEFIPDAARHINLNVVFVQRIINRVAIEEGGGTAMP